MPDFNNLNT